MAFGTPRYQAPEISRMLALATPSLTDDTLDAVISDARVDVYSYGLVLHEILHGRIAFAGDVPMAAMCKAMSGARPPIVLRPEHGPLAAIIEACWHADVACRPSMEKVVEALTA